MLKEKVNVLFDILDASVGVIAEYANTDITNISRIKSGARNYKANSKTVEKLLDGVLDYSENAGKTEVLDALISSRGYNRREDLRSWLFSGNVQKEQENRLAAFPDKLNAVIKIAGISNNKLARLTNIDASYVSRIRNGIRMPSASSAIYEVLSRVLYDEIEKGGKLEELKRLIRGINPEVNENLYAVYNKWLCNSTVGDGYIEAFLGSIDQMSFPEPGFLKRLMEAETLENGHASSLETAGNIEISSVEDLIRGDLDPVSLHAEFAYKEQTSYLDDVGLQEAVVRFLSEAIRSDAKEIYLYSERQIEWMTKDPIFRTKWALMMKRLIMRGIRIKIIHNIDRNVSEMVNAVRSWLPLYMTGMIESYYTNIKGGKRFQHTMFVCPDVACICGVHLFGDPHAMFHYCTENETVSYYAELFHSFMAKCMPLVQIEKGSLPLVQIGISKTNDSPAVESRKEHGTDRTGENAEASDVTMVRNKEFPNIEIEVGPASVVVKRLVEPKVSFVILNRQLCDAIIAYCSSEKGA